jgi:AraC family transcriptional regulator
MPESLPSEGSVFIQKVGGGAWAFCRFKTEPDGIRSAWEESFRWLVESGYECRPLPCAEIYLNDARYHPEGKWIIDIAIPLITE